MQQPIYTNTQNPTKIHTAHQTAVVVAIDNQRPSQNAPAAPTSVMQTNNPINSDSVAHVTHDTVQNMPITVTVPEPPMAPQNDPVPITSSTGSDAHVAILPVVTQPSHEDETPVLEEVPITTVVLAMVHNPPPDTTPSVSVVENSVVVGEDNPNTAGPAEATNTTMSVSDEKALLVSSSIAGAATLSSTSDYPIATTTAINTKITSTNPTILPIVVVPLDSNHELETSLSTVSASTSSPSSSPVAVIKTSAADSANNNHHAVASSSEPSYQNTEQVAIAAGGVPSAGAAVAEVTQITPKVEENNNRTSIGDDKKPLENGHGAKSKNVEEVDGVPKSPSVDTRNNNTAALGDSPVLAVTSGAVSKEGNDFSHLERMYNNLYDNQEMVVRMMTANLGRPDGDEDLQFMMPPRPPLPQQIMYDIPVTPPAGEWPRKGIESQTEVEGPENIETAD